MKFEDVQKNYDRVAERYDKWTDLVFGRILGVEQLREHDVMSKLKLGLKRWMWLLALQCATVILALSGCRGADDNAEPIFPANFQETFTEARPCFFTHEHDLRYIRVFADALAYPTYTEFVDPYPVGATIVKVEYESPDDCEGIVQYTAMKKLEPGANPDGHDWWWQRVSTDRRVLEEGAPARCIACHTEHCEEPNGYDLTCKPEASGF